MTTTRLAILSFFVELISRAACGQSPVVFLAESSRVIRFDSGAESSVIHNNAFGITTLNGILLVANFNDAIQKYSPNGDLLGNFALLKTPTFLESDSRGNIYATPLAEPGPAMAARFNSAGVLTQSFYIPDGSGINGIDADADGNVYVVETLSYRNSFLYKFAQNGTFLNRTLLPFVLVGDDIAIDEVGKRLFIADEFDGSQGIKVFDISGATPSFINSITTPANGAYHGVDYSEGSGDLLVVDTGILSHDPRGLEYSPNGTLLREYRAFNGSTLYDIVAAAVPEPNTGLLALLGCGFIWRGRSRFNA
jgi:hypothetical protein